MTGAIELEPVRGIGLIRSNIWDICVAIDAGKEGAYI